MRSSDGKSLVFVSLDENGWVDPVVRTVWSCRVHFDQQWDDDELEDDEGDGARLQTEKGEEQGTKHHFGLLGDRRLDVLDVVRRFADHQRQSRRRQIG